MSNLRKSLEIYTNGLFEGAKESKEKADKAFETGDLGLAGYHRGRSTVMESTGMYLIDLLADYKEDEE
ncbi:glyoxalase [Bacillus pseudomycoides]|uniref:glyoxalase n=1 Tax=Bacillus pseudomycoides TaxID=64104 RepID=UPI000BF936F5|nr:glyoxalase [Bacillus pseudomycoides]PEP86128.1 glyoxalase [Bacillus pseudomycoides]